MAADPSTNEVLATILEILKQQAIHLDRVHRWMLGLAEAVETDPVLGARLREHPFYNQGVALQLQSIEMTTQHIDALIRQLRKV